MARRRSAIAIAALLPLLAACTGAGGNPVTLVPSVTLSHFIALETQRDGTPVAVADRSVAPEMMTVLEYDDGSSRTAASAWVIGVLPGGTSIPDLTGLDPDPTYPGNYIRTVISNDGFLDEVGSGDGFALGRYSVRNRARDRLFLGYRFVGDIVSNRPATGSAAYEGIAHAMMFGSFTGARDVSGRAALKAEFDGAGGSVSGRLSDLKAGGQPVGYELVLQPAGISEAAFLGGRIAVEGVGGAPSGATVTSSDWQGMFFGAGAKAAAGTFTLGADGVPRPGGGTESVQGVGGFGGSR